MKGTIKFYNSNDGYGFIFSADTNKDYHFKVTEWKNETLPNAGQKVEFSEFESKKGFSAKDIKLLEDCLKGEPNKNDDRITCPNCAKKIIPRMQFNNGEPYATLCPFCATEVKKFEPKPDPLGKIAYYLIVFFVLGALLYAFVPQIIKNFFG